MITQFYMTPGSCSTGIHILLEELELPFEVYLVNLLNQDHQQAAYKEMNPKGTIPMLIPVDGKPLTDYLSISWWLARQHPVNKLLPEGIELEVKALELMSFAVNEIHGQGFTRVFTPEKYVTGGHNDLELIKSQGQTRVLEAFEVITQVLNQAGLNKGLLFEHITIADTALFYVEFWAKHLDYQLPQRLDEHFATMMQRPTVRQVLAEEGYGHMLNRF